MKNAIDLNPRDDVVRAPLAGTVRVQHCGGGDWITVDHADGWRTGYYHLVNIVVADGQQVEMGAELGQVGNALPCGGSSSGAHVHFTLWRLDALGARSGDPIAAGNWDGVSYERLETEVAAAAGESLTGRVFGGWTLQECTSQYSGSVTNVRSGETVRLPGTSATTAELAADLGERGQSNAAAPRALLARRTWGRAAHIPLGRLPKASDGGPGPRHPAWSRASEEHNRSMAKINGGPRPPIIQRTDEHRQFRRAEINHPPVVHTHRAVHRQDLHRLRVVGPLP